MSWLSMLEYRNSKYGIVRPPLDEYHLLVNQDNELWGCKIDDYPYYKKIEFSGILEGFVYGRIRNKGLLQYSFVFKEGILLDKEFRAIL